MAEAQSTTHLLEDQKTASRAQEDYLTKLADRDTIVAKLQNQLTKLDTDKTEALNHALETNADLRSDLSVAQRMRLTGTTCARPAAGSETSRPSSVGNEPGIELSPETRYAVFDLRAGLVSDRAKLDYLQAYIRQVGLSSPVSP